MWVESFLSRHSDNWTTARYEWAVPRGMPPKDGTRVAAASLTAGDFAALCLDGGHLGEADLLVVEVASVQPADVGSLRDWLQLGIPDELVDRAAMFCIDPDLPNSQAAVQLQVFDPDDASKATEILSETTVEVRRILFPGVVISERSIALLVRRARVLQSGGLCMLVWERATADPGSLALPTGAPEPSTDVDPAEALLPSEEELAERRRFWTVYDKWIFEPGMLPARTLPGSPGSAPPATAVDAAESYVLQAASSSVSAVERLKELAEGFEIDALEAATETGAGADLRADLAQMAARLIRTATSLRRLVRWMDTSTIDDPPRWFAGGSEHGVEIRSQLDRAYQGAREVAGDLKDLLPALAAIAKGSRASDGPSPVP
jgi:hypothetical protein